MSVIMSLLRNVDTFKMWDGILILKHALTVQCGRSVPLIETVVSNSK